MGWRANKTQSCWSWKAGLCASWGGLGAGCMTGFGELQRWQEGGRHGPTPSGAPQGPGSMGTRCCCPRETVFRRRQLKQRLLPGTGPGKPSSASSFSSSHPKLISRAGPDPPCPGNAAVFTQPMAVAGRRGDSASGRREDMPRPAARNKDKPLRHQTRCHAPAGPQSNPAPAEGTLGCPNTSPSPALPRGCLETLPHLRSPGMSEGLSKAVPEPETPLER